jgi:hypothetical protein
MIKKVYVHFMVFFLKVSVVLFPAGDVRSAKHVTDVYFVRTGIVISKSGNCHVVRVTNIELVELCFNHYVHCI